MTFIGLYLILTGFFSQDMYDVQIHIGTEIDTQSKISGKRKQGKNWEEERKREVREREAQRDRNREILTMAI